MTLAPEWLAPLGEREPTQRMFAGLQAALHGRGLALRAPPPEPTSCCGRGCNGCVWEGFYAAAEFWREDALTLLGAAA